MELEDFTGWLLPIEAGAQLGLSERAVYYHVKLGVIPPPIGRPKRHPPSSVQRIQLFRRWRDRGNPLQECITELKEMSDSDVEASLPQADPGEVKILFEQQAKPTLTLVLSAGLSLVRAVTCSPLDAKFADEIANLARDRYR